MGNLVVFDHPLIKHKLTHLRDKNTGSKEFKELTSEIAMLMAFEATREMSTKFIEIETPISKMESEVIDGKKLAIIPILRAGLGMVEGILSVVPSARIGHIGLYRDPETLEPVEYYCKLPKDIENRELLVVDPMIATGGSADAAVKYLKAQGVKGKNIKLLCIIAAEEGIKELQKNHPDIKIYAAGIDKELNEDAYIVPGLGDAGDRLFGTK